MMQLPAAPAAGAHGRRLQPQQHTGQQQHCSRRYHQRASTGLLVVARSRRACTAVAASSQQQQPSSSQQQRSTSGGTKVQPPANISSRNARLYELFGDDGWGVDAVPAADGGAQQQGASTQPAQASTPPPAAPAAAAPAAPKAARRKAGTPFADMRSEEGVLGLTLLQKVLANEEAAAAAAAGGSPAAAAAAGNKGALADIKARLAAAATAGSSKRSKPKLPGFPKAGAAGAAGGGGAAAAAAGLARRGADADEEDREEWEEDEGWDEDEDEPAFQISFDEQGRAEFKDFNSSGLIIDGGGAAAAPPSDGDGDEDEEEGEQQQWLASSSSSSSRGGRRRAQDPTVGDADAQAEEDLALLRDLSNEDDWGLDALTAPGFGSGAGHQPGRRSLIDELTAAAEEGEAGLGGSASGSGANVQWGGTAGTTGIDLEEQEALLARYFRPDQVKKLMAEQVEVDASYSELRKRAVGLGVSDHKLHEKLRIVSGSAAGRKLVSFRSTQTRPMMEKVRQAIFNMLQSRAGTLNALPTHARWLDLFAGTGSVGLEALSRGVKEAHFVEMDPVVVNKVLGRNIRACGFKGRAWTHTTKAEDFLRRAAELPRFAGGAFDYISVCPPYLLVSYPELFALLDASPLLHEGSVVFVEYPKQLAGEVADAIGPLRRVRDRRYGRTWVALYAAGGGGDEDGEEGGGGEDDGVGGGPQDDPFLAML